MRISDWSSDVCSSDLLLVAALADGAFGWSTGVLRSTTALRLAVERAADETAAGGDPRRRHRLGAAMCAVRDSLRLPYGRAEQVRHRARLLVLPPDASTAVFPLAAAAGLIALRSEEHTSELQSLMRISYAGFCLKKKKHTT